MHDGHILKVSKKDTTSQYFSYVIMPNLNRCLPTGAQLCSFPVSKNLFKVRKIALEQQSDDRCSNVINIAEFEQVFANVRTMFHSRQKNSHSQQNNARYLPAGLRMLLDFEHVFCPT